MSRDQHLLREEVRELLIREAGQRESIASEIGAMVDQHVRRELAGEKVALMSRADRAARAARIRAEFTGGNHRDLRRRYQLGKTQLWRILRSNGSG